MARDKKPMTEADFEALETAMADQAEELRRALAEDLGGDPEDYRVGERVAVDGGEQ